MSNGLYFIDSQEKLTKEKIGGKGYYLHQMKQDNLPIPEAAFITTDLWKKYQQEPEKTANHIKKKVVPEIIAYFKKENAGKLPLLSVRSAGAVSMPGMMDTVLNVGLTSEVVKKASAKDKEFMLDSYSRLCSMYGETVLGIEKDKFKGKPKKFKTVEDLNGFYEGIFKKHKVEIPSSPEEQIYNCIVSVFDSWNNDRAKLYRSINKIDENAGTAVVIQKMVFGNKNNLSATGVLFSRNPSNGKNQLSGEYLVCAQGEDVVSGSHTPKGLSELEFEMPEIYKDLKKISKDLEYKYQQVQDIEFTIENEKLYILQARTAKCSPYANLTMLMDMYRAKTITAKDVMNRMTLNDYLDLNIKQVDQSYAVVADGVGLPASMGAISGRVVFGPSSKYKGDPTIFLATETTPDDLQAIQKANGILTASGGVTSHAAVVARGMGKICIVGCSDLKVEIKDGNERATLGDVVLKSGDWITMDANQGKVWVGNEVPIIDAQNSKMFWDLEDLVFEAYPEWTRVTSKVDEIIKDKKTYFLTYTLDNEGITHVADELEDATKYLNGVMDLTGALDYLKKRYDNDFLLTEDRAEKVFLKKKNILLNITGKKTDFELYLGPYENAHAADFKKAGYKIKNEKDVSFDDKNLSASIVISQKYNKQINPTSLAISSKNALLGILK